MSDESIAKDVTPKLALTRVEAAKALEVSAETVDRLTLRGLLRPSRATRRPLYSLKRGLESVQSRYAGDFYELTKFGGSCDVTLSESIPRVIEGRRLIGQRRRLALRRAE